MPGLFEIMSGNASMTFDGTYRFASADDLEAAIDAVRDMLDAEDAELATDFDAALRRRGTELRVRLASDCPRDWYYGYATLVEALAERAIGGTVEGRLEGSDHVESYVAAAASNSLSMRRVQAPAPTWDAAASAVSDALAELTGRTAVIEERARDAGPRPGTEPGIGAIPAPAPSSVASRPGAGEWIDPAEVRRTRPSPRPAAAVRAPDTVVPPPRPSATAGLTRVPELMSLGELMKLPELEVPSLVLIPELVPPADLGVLTRSVAIAANEMVTPEEGSSPGAGPASSQSVDGDLVAALSEIAGDREP